MSGMEAPLGARSEPASEARSEAKPSGVLG
jgi:hypothetical protein